MFKIGDRVIWTINKAYTGTIVTIYSQYKSRVKWDVGRFSGLLTSMSNSALKQIPITSKQFCKITYWK